jgi:hypothetical protein
VPALPTGAWPALRAALIALVLVVSWVDAMPLPELSASDLRYEMAGDEIRAWQGVLARVGIVVSEGELAEAGLAIGARSTAFRRGILRPFRPFFRVTGVGQAWGLFAYPDPHAGRLVVEGRAGEEEWQPLYVAPGADEPLEAVLECRRVRGVYDDVGDRPRPGAAWLRFADWIAALAFARYPELDEVRVRLPYKHIVVPGRESDKKRPEVPLRHSQVRKRDAAGGDP